MKIHTSLDPFNLPPYFTMNDHRRSAKRMEVTTWSTDSVDFHETQSQAGQVLRHLLEVPQRFRTFFTLSDEAATHQVVSALGSKKGRLNQMTLDPEQKNLQLSDLSSGKTIESPLPEAILSLQLTNANEGTRIPNTLLTNISTRFADHPILVDADYSFPFAASDYANLDGVHFSVNTGFGLPDPVRVWMVDERLAKSFEPAPLPPMSIYLLAGMLSDYHRRGLGMIRSETVYKSTLLYHALEKCRLLEPLIAERPFRSTTIIAARALEPTMDWRNYFRKKGIDVFHHANKLLFANFPVHSREQFEMLVDVIADL